MKCETCGKQSTQLICNADSPEENRRYFCDWNCLLAVNDKRLARIENKINEILKIINVDYKGGIDVFIEPLEEPKE